VNRFKLKLDFPPCLLLLTQNTMEVSWQNTKTRVQPSFKT